jgi:hypothetical protein
MTSPDAYSVSTVPRLNARLSQDMTMAQETANAIELLQQDHRMVEELFEQFEQVKDEDEEVKS